MSSSISNILASNKSRHWVQHELKKIHTEESAQLVEWLSNPNDIIELIQILMKLVNQFLISGPERKKEARFLFIKILQCCSIDNVDFYVQIFDSTVELAIWAKNGGLKRTGRRLGCIK